MKLMELSVIYLFKKIQILEMYNITYNFFGISIKSLENIVETIPNIYVMLNEKDIFL